MPRKPLDSDQPAARSNNHSSTLLERLAQRLTSRRRFVGGAAKVGGGLSFLSLASGGAAAWGENRAKLTIENQRSDGASVTVASVAFTEGGFVAIHDDSLLDGDAIGSVVGVSEKLDAGYHEDVDVPLFDVRGASFDRSRLAEDGTLIAMPHFDTNGNGTYDFVATEGSEDGPYTENGKPVTDEARVRVERDSDVTQAPALPGAQEISSADRVYTADQSSNTVSVIDPAGNGNEGEVLGTIPLGERRLDGVLGPVDTNQVNVHGLGFSRDGDALDAISVTSNAAQVIDTSTNEVEETTYVGRTPHEGFISPDGKELWVAVRGEDYVAVVSREDGAVTERIETAPGASKVVFSPDGRLAFVNHLRTTELVVVKVANRKIIERIDIQEKAGGSADLATSPDGEEVWLGHPLNGYTTVVDAREFEVKASFETGPRTNHPNFVTKHDGAFAYVTVGGENHTEVFRRADSYDGHPEHVETIEHSGVAPHGIWPSPDNTHVYVALQKSDAVDVINTELNEVIETLDVGQDPQALVYVAGTDPADGGRKNLTEQGLDKRIENFTVDTSRVGGEDPAGLVSVRELTNLDEVDVTVGGFPANRTFTVHATDGEESTAILDITTDDEGNVGEALAFVNFFENDYDRVFVVP